MLPASLNIIISSDVSNDVYESSVNYDGMQILLLPRRYFLHHIALSVSVSVSDLHQHAFILIMRILIKILIHFQGSHGYILHTVALSGIQSFPDDTRAFYIVTLYFYPN